MEHDQQEFNIQDMLEYLQTGEKELKTLHIRVVHNHLPLLDEIGAIDWDRNRNQVRKGPEFERTMEILEQIDNVIDADVQQRNPITESHPSLGGPVDILLVEDNPGDVRLTEEAFKEVGIQNTLHVVGDGEEALDFLYQCGKYIDAPRPALVLLDLFLPQKSGEEVVAKLKDDPELKSIPVIILTGSKRPRNVMESDDVSADAYLTKPLDPGEFIKKVIEVEGIGFSIISLSDQ
jgi:CheY-like chemotaxis protein